MSELRPLEPELLLSFVAIAETGSFTDAAARVLRTQSAVSMQVRRLEARLGGRRLFAKAGRGVALSADGELFLAHARRLLRAHREVLCAFDGAALEGRVRVGAPDDYASTFLPPALARFAGTHPRVEVETVCETSDRLVPLVGRGELDVAVATQGSGEAGGVLLRREPLVWVGGPDRAAALLGRSPLPLALFHPGCLFRRAALEAMAAAGRACRTAYTSVSVAGVTAAVSAGLAVGVMARSTVPASLRVLGERDGLPPLPAVGIVLLRPEAGAAPASPAADALAADLAAALGEPAPLPAAA